MLREVALKSLIYSLTRVGMRYVIIFSITSYIYLHMYRSVLSFVIMLFLSILMMISSILSDRRDIIQLIFVLYLVGARKKILFLATAVFTSLRSLLITIVYSIAMLDNPSIAPTVLFTYVVVTVILSLIMVRGVVPRV